MHGKYIVVKCKMLSGRKMPIALIFSAILIGPWSLFLSAGVFPPVWYKHVSEIAAKSPLLLSMGAEQFLDKELEVNHPLKIENIVPVSPQLYIYSNVAWVSCTSRLHM